MLLIGFIIRKYHDHSPQIVKFVLQVHFTPANKKNCTICKYGFDNS